MCCCPLPSSSGRSPVNASAAGLLVDARGERRPDNCRRGRQAAARKLLIALWRLVTTGETPLRAQEGEANETANVPPGNTVSARAGFAADCSVPRSTFLTIVDRILPTLRRLERILRPRVGWLAGPWARVPVGIICLAHSPITRNFHRCPPSDRAQAPARATARLFRRDSGRVQASR